MKYIFLFVIQLYRLTLSKVFPSSCRYTPSCSMYALIAVRRFGAVKGGYLSIRRIIRCNPYSKGGEDNVPEVFSWRKKTNEVV